MLVVQSSDARQLRDTSNFGSISVTAGAFSASTPPPPAQLVGTDAGEASKASQSGIGVAAPTQERIAVPPGSPVEPDASASISGRRMSRNSPMPPRITPYGLR